MTFMAAAGSAWTVLVVIGRRWWNRRLKPLIQDVNEPAEKKVEE